MKKINFGLICVVFGILLGVIIVGGVNSFSITNRNNFQQQTQYSSTSTLDLSSATIEEAYPQLPFKNIINAFPANAVVSSTCFFELAPSTCLMTYPQFKELAADLPALNLIAKGHVVVSANSVYVPTSNTSSTDLITVLNAMEAQINHVSQ